MSSKKLCLSMQPQQLLQELPLFGTLDSLHAERGFGFLSCSGQTEKVFFHFNDACQPSAKNSLSLGEPILFILGTDPSRQAKQAMHWARVTDLFASATKPSSEQDSLIDSLPPIDQASLNELRHASLAARPWHELKQQLHADWYHKKLWQHEAPDKLDDPTLLSVLREKTLTLSPQELAKDSDFLTQRMESAFKERLLALPPQSLAEHFSPLEEWMPAASIELKQHLMQWHLLRYNGRNSGPSWAPWFSGQQLHEVAVAEFFIEQNLTRNTANERWIRQLIDNNLLSPQAIEQWVGNHPSENLRLFQHLSRKRQQFNLLSWKRDPSKLHAILDENPAIALTPLVLNTVLALDLETDGQTIWQLGCAQAGQANLLFTPHCNSDLPTALNALAEQIGRSLLVLGHNILAWDWPIISQRLALSQPPLLWDTLLVQYLLTPQAQSHALGGNHRADTDALMSAQLFEQQLQQLPQVTRALLTSEFNSEAELVTALAPLTADLPCASQQPDWLSQQTPTNAVLLLPEQRLNELNWVPGVRIISANPAESLPQNWQQIDPERFTNAVTASVRQQPLAIILLAVIRRAAAQNIALRFGMIPLWVRESSPELLSALQQACYEPQNLDSQLLVAPLPQDLQPILDAGPDKFQLLGFSDKTLVLDQRSTALKHWSGTAAEARTAATSVLLGLPQNSPAQLWLHTDRPARKLSLAGGWRSFQTLSVPSELMRAIPYLREGIRPTLATRLKPTLYPSTIDQASYWAEIIRSFREIARPITDAVPILLIGSSCCLELRELLRTGLAELGLGDIQPDHRSRQQHLVRIARQQGGLVDFVDNWSAWQQVAQLAGVSLQPVLEALPLEQWLAQYQHQASPIEADFEQDDSPNEAHLDDDDTDGDDVDWKPEVAKQADNTSTITPYSLAILLKAMPDLLKTFLQPWLHQSGLVLAKHNPVLLDPRIDQFNNLVRASVQVQPLPETPLTDAENSQLLSVFEPLQIQREEAPTDYASMEQFLIQNWSTPDKPIAGFKDSQKPAITAIGSRNNDVLVALPTGEGKSVLFQVPALCRGLRTRRLTLVISPLKALMRDQIEGLHQQGFSESSDYLSSDRPPHETTEVLQGILDHRIVLLYVAPERFRSDRFLAVLGKRIESDGALEYAVIDETHCIHHWGYDFRPDYFHALSLLLKGLPGICMARAPVLLLSATVTASDKLQLGRLLTANQPSLKLTALPETVLNPLRSHIQVQPQAVSSPIYGPDFTLALAKRLPTILQAINDARANQAKTSQRSALIIFVTQRTHAEQLAQELARNGIATVDYFHAGLDAASRDEIYQNFKDGRLQVLVATKAFGMGMDIPDIHWAIHLSPPSYLEDYLQEVGRIGRGEQQRKQAQLDSLNARLLFSPGDFEHLRSQQKDNALQLPAIKKQLQEIVSHAQEIEGQLIAIVPQCGFSPAQNDSAKRAQATQLRMALFWLERANAVELCGSIPNLLPASLDLATLRTLAQQKDHSLSELAQLMLDLPCFQAKASQADSDSALKHALADLGSTLGFRLQTERASPAESCYLNLPKIMSRCSFNSQSQALQQLTELEQAGGLTLERSFQFTKLALSLEPQHKLKALFEAVDMATQQLLKELNAAKGKVQFDPDELFIYTAPAENSKTPELYQAAYRNATLCLARRSGIRIRQIVTADQQTRWQASLAGSSQTRAGKCRNTTMQIADEVWQQLLKSISNAQASSGSQTTTSHQISLASLIRASTSASPTRRFRETELKSALSLLASMKLVRLYVSISSSAYVVQLKPNHTELDNQTELWQELGQINRFASLRLDSMEIFANLPVEAQQRFIEGYFSQQNAADLQHFLESQLGELDDSSNPNLSDFIRDKLTQLRATAVSDSFQRYQQSEEPNQWHIIQHPYNQHLLVNAGPGAGKTSVLINRVAHLIHQQHISPSEIIVLAFNRAVISELKRRLKDLFGKLGYASYVKSLRVSTFHSFAMKELSKAQIELPNQKALLKTFATRLSSDLNFRQQVVRGCRSILVDEFQDVTQDIFQIITQLYAGSGSQAGVMVIGDDDQDILRWNREDKNFSEVYFNQFRQHFAEERFTHVELSTNFRSDAKIVERSQHAISVFFKKNKQSQRLKQSQLKAFSQNQNSAASVSKQESNWPQALAHAREQLGNLSSGSLAILCRTNAEVAQAHHELSQVTAKLSVQGNVNLPVADLRHIGRWLDWLKYQTNEELTAALKEHWLSQFTAKVCLPETRNPMADAVQPQALWDLCCQELTYPHVSDLIRFIEELQTDELDRLLNANTAKSRSHAVVSTIHKVKGLEFEQVIVLPSTSDFGQKSNNLVMDAAEEMRLLYVAMTRAKQKLTYFVGDRELCWRDVPTKLFKPKGPSAQAKRLEGSPEEVVISWSMTKEGIDLQTYIEQKVQVGDKIRLSGRGKGAFKVLMHRGTAIGYLAEKAGAGSAHSALHVSAVIRYKPNPDDIKSEYPLTEQVAKQGWGYVVLVEGQL